MSLVSLVGGKSNNQVIYSKCRARGFGPWIDSRSLPLDSRRKSRRCESIYMRHCGHTRHPSSSLLPLERFSGTTVSSRARKKKKEKKLRGQNDLKFLLWPCSPIPGTEGRERCQRRICEYWLNSTYSRFSNAISIREPIHVIYIYCRSSRGDAKAIGRD